MKCVGVMRRLLFTGDCVQAIRLFCAGWRGVCRRSFGAEKKPLFIFFDKKTAIQERTFKKMTTFAPYTPPVCRHIEESVFASFP